MEVKNHKSSDLVNAILMLHAFIIILLLAYWGKFLFIPLFFSFLIAVFLYPLCKWFERHHLSRLLSSVLCLLLLLLSCAVIIYFVGAQFQRFLKDIPALKDKFGMLLKNSQVWLQQHFNIDYSTQSGYLNKSLNSFANAIGFTVSSSFTILIFVTLAIFFIFYILLYRELLRDFILFPFNRIYKKRISEMSYTLNATIINYVKGLLIEMFILIVLSAITLLILGIKYALLMAFFAGIFNIIPYIGIYTATFLNMLITITDGTGKQSLEVCIRSKTVMHS